MLDRVVISPDFVDTLDKHPAQREGLKSKLKDFISLKNDTPSNGVSTQGIGFGNTDKRFVSGDEYNRTHKDLSHAHLTHNISVIYKITDNILYLFGVYTHDDMGTGTTNSKNLKRQTVARIANTIKRNNFSDLSNQLTPVEKKQVVQKSPTAKPDYTQKQRVQPQAPQQSQKQIEIQKLVQNADKAWPNRNFSDQFLNTGYNVSKIATLIQNEVKYLADIKSRSRLYPNQLSYFAELQRLYDLIQQR